MLEKLSHTEEETRALGAELGRRLFAGAVVALHGPLGAGKTTFVKGVARGLEAEEEDVTSPTFVLLQIYEGRLPIYHFDAYRLEEAKELSAIGAEEYLWGDGVSLLEWAERATPILPPDRLEVTIEIPEPDTRRFRFEPTGRETTAALEGF